MEGPGRRIFIAGLLLQLCAFIGLVGTIRQLRGGLEALGTGGVLDPSKVVVVVSESMHPTVVGLFGNFVGSLLMVFALWHWRLRERWMLVWSFTVGIVFFPVTLLPLIYCFWKRREFPPRLPGLTA